MDKIGGTMARRVNYHGERLERDRAKAKKRAARIEAKVAKANAHKDEKTESPAEPGSPGTVQPEK
jgi:hypothetical protein